MTPTTPTVGQVRVWNADTYTRIMIPLGGQAKYQAARISDPDRIYFDIEGAKLSAKLSAPVDVPSGGYLKAVRMAQNHPDVVRVVLEVTKVKDYSVFELANPDRLVVDVYGPAADIAPTQRRLRFRSGAKRYGHRTASRHQRRGYDAMPTRQQRAGQLRTTDSTNATPADSPAKLALVQSSSRIGFGSHVKASLRATRHCETGRDHRRATAAHRRFAQEGRRGHGPCGDA